MIDPCIGLSSSYSSTLRTIPKIRTLLATNCCRGRDQYFCGRWNLWKSLSRRRLPHSLTRSLPRESTTAADGENSIFSATWEGINAAEGTRGLWTILRRATFLRPEIEYMALIHDAWRFQKCTWEPYWLTFKFHSINYPTLTQFQCKIWMLSNMVLQASWDNAMKFISGGKN